MHTGQIIIQTQASVVFATESPGFWVKPQLYTVSLWLSTMPFCTMSLWLNTKPFCTMPLWLNNMPNYTKPMWLNLACMYYLCHMYYLCMYYLCHVYVLPYVIATCTTFACMYYLCCTTFAHTLLPRVLPYVIALMYYFCPYVIATSYYLCPYVLPLHVLPLPQIPQSSLWLLASHERNIVLSIICLFVQNANAGFFPGCMPPSYIKAKLTYSAYERN